MKFFYFLIFAMMMLPSCQPTDPTLVTIEQGKLQGMEEDGILVWKGVPFAQPPIHDLRWKSPQPLQPWQGIKSAQRYGNICPSTGYGEQSIYEIPPEEMSEDCLYLNVWSPTISPKKKMPVFVWIHGGSLTREGGTHPQYLGKNLAKKGIVYVSINYRLHAFGFLAHPELSAENEKGISGNYGMLDQISALEWVQKNISAFGGDPSNVTIGGESAGGWSVTLLTASPLAKGLFQQAIAQSGAYLWGGPHLQVAKNGYVSGEEEGKEFMSKLNANSLEEIRAVPADSIVQLFFSNKNNLSSEPIVDGYVFTEDVKDTYAQSKHHKVDVITGANADEWSLWVPKSLPTDPEIYRQQIEKKYPGQSSLFFNTYPVKDSASIAQAYVDFQSDQNFHLHNRNWAKEMSKGGNRVFMYYFSKTPAERYPKEYGAFHGAEIVYALNNLENDPGSIGAGVISESDQAYANMVSNYWINFIKTGNPNGDGLKEWKSWTAKEEAYLEFGEEVRQGQFLLNNRLNRLELFLSENK
jgi:para-nitrobenzyl esterase